MNATAATIVRPPPILPFATRLSQEGTCLNRIGIHVVQINVGKLCNQSCSHCHVEAGPHRTEIMTRKTAELVADFVRATEAQTVDITGGAPELNPSFRWLVKQLVNCGRHVMDRCNLTVLSEPGQGGVAEFLADLGVEIIASLPCYTQENVDWQRGQGVYHKSIAALKQLNALGYGQAGSGLVLNLVYNPLGAFLPGSQAELEVDYKRKLDKAYGISFNRLLTMTNAPLGRFGRTLHESDEYATYCATLVTAFNPSTLDALMCRKMVSIGWDGFVYDCDFNQMLGLRLGNGRPFRLGELDMAELAHRIEQADVRTGDHCYGCTAGAGSSCGGVLA